MPGVLSDIPRWEAPPTSTKDFDYAGLQTLDLSTVTGDEYEQVPADVVKTIGEALSQDGFIYVTNHGLRPDEVQRQFDLAQYAFDGVSEADKAKYAAKISETGDYTGYKPRGHWKLRGVPDQIEHLGLGDRAFRPGERENVFPPALLPFADEIAAFRRYNHIHIFRKILTVLSLVLKLPPTYLWNLANEESGLFRYALYHPPPQEDDVKTDGVRLQGHSDFRSVTLLYSQPIVSLQVLMPDNVWRYVRHVPNALVLNLGDATHFLSGGYLKPTIHRVVSPPDPDQAKYRRLGVFYFAAYNPDVRLVPLTQSPVVASTGKTFFNEGRDAPTAWQWEKSRVRAYGQDGEKKRLDNGHEEEAMIGGEKVVHYN
ncbi:Clavaminate synthase-like protein [Punctularia strigosozonata HHB-11173 SS5]|uniref:Clavaminate synthase-like protein n=1 Tax=Punctularia strigosozonata (strain HHB-11173) TaxID=741275 RepID=UPI000441695C|nr:Clavaminate synthase-like protein [Punctularia strigosozonata HHB-11173 SS5]EIN12439.1 Clavaminate synthase-like protein [Punctularia strigosozonata HHB-11173 SS5]